MDGLYTLVVVVSYSSELLIESGELGVIFLRFLINLHYLELSTEDTGKDKFGFVFHARLLEHGDKLFVLSVIETEVIEVRLRRTDIPERTFGARLSAGGNIFNR